MFPSIVGWPKDFGCGSVFTGAVLGLSCCVFTGAVVQTVCLEVPQLQLIFKDIDISVVALRLSHGPGYAADPCDSHSCRTSGGRCPCCAVAELVSVLSQRQVLDSWDEGRLLRACTQVQGREPCPQGHGSHNQVHQLALSTKTFVTHLVRTTTTTTTTTHHHQHTHTKPLSSPLPPPPPTTTPHPPPHHHPHPTPLHPTPLHPIPSHPIPSHPIPSHTPFTTQTKPNRTEPNQTKPNQTKPSQAKPNHHPRSKPASQPPTPPPFPPSSLAKVDANFDSGAWSILPMNTFILAVYLMSFLLKPFLHVSCMVTIMMILQCSYFHVVFSFSFHSLQFILIVTITCSTDLDDSPDIHTTCLTCCVVVRSSSWFSQLVCWNTMHMESGLEGISRLWKSEWTGSICELERPRK